MSTEKFAYTFRTEIAEDGRQFFASFVDGSGHHQETEISRAVYMALEDCRKHEQRQTRSDIRHAEQSLLSDEQLAAAVTHRKRGEPPKRVRDEAFGLSDNTNSFDSGAAPRRAMTGRKHNDTRT
jgi:hypothetical protein